HVVGDDVLDLGRRAADELGDVLHRVAGDVALLLLHDEQRRDDRRLAMLRRVVRADLLESCTVLRRVGKRRPRLGKLPLALVPTVAVRHLWVKTHVNAYCWMSDA